MSLIFSALILFGICVSNFSNFIVHAEDEAPFHIGIVTGTVSQAEDEQRGAESMVEKYGDASEGRYIIHKNYPDNYMAEQETTIQQIVSLADDEKMKVIVVNQ